MKKYTNNIISDILQMRKYMDLHFQKVSKLKILVLLILSVWLNISAIAQTEDCGSVITAEDIGQLRQYQERLQRFQPTSERLNRAVARIPITAHIIRRADRSGGLSETDLNNAIAGANTFYRNANIEFFLQGSINYIDRDEYYDYDKSEEAGLLAYNVANTINIFFAGNVTAGTIDLCGYASFPFDVQNGRDLVVMDNLCTNNGSTFPHELGHYFYLLHTHETAAGKELVTRGAGKNCDNAGDLLCDTPADPKLGSSNSTINCEYTGTEVDDNGDSYTPMVNNIMSYAYKSCRTLFTTGQYERIEDALYNTRAYLLGKPDYTITEMSVDADPIIPGVDFRVDYLIANEGSGDGGEAAASFYLSTNSTLDQGDVLVRTVSTPAVAAGQNTSRYGTRSVPADTPPGVYYFIAEMDPQGVIDESNENNNTFAIQINVGGDAPKPDYTITEMSVDADPVMPGVDFRVDYLIANEGNGDGGEAAASFYLSTNSTLDQGDVLVRTVSTPAVAAGQNTSRYGTRSIPADTPPGVYYFIAEMDPQGVIDESNENNNTFAIQINVGSTPKPDYQPTSITGPPTAEAGQGLTVQVIIKNNGTVDGLGNGGKDKYYISDNSSLNASNLNGTATLLASYDTDNIAAGETKQYPGGFDIPATLTPGEYYIYYFLDADNRVDESNENNNIVSYQLSITGPSTGLEVDFMADNTNPCVGETVQFTSTVSGGSSNMAYDFSGNGNHGTLKDFQDGAFVDNSGYGKAINFAGTGNHVSIGDLGAMSNWTVETWFKVDLVNSNENLFHSQDLGLNSGLRVEIFKSSSPSYGKMTAVLSGGTGFSTYPIIPHGGDLSNEWHHLAIVGDKANNKIYIYFDGAKVIDRTHTNWPTSFPNFVLGRGLSDHISRDYSGEMDEVRIWNTARSQADIQTYKDQQLSGSETGLVAYYNFENPPIITDHSAQGYDALLKGEGPSLVDHSGFGKALNFNGTDNYATLPENVTTGLENVTFETWFYTGNVKTWERIFDFGTDTENFISLTASSGWNGGRPQFHNRFGGEYQVVDYPDVIAPNTWYHFAIVWDANGLVKMYLNGELKAEETINKKPSDIGNFTNNALGRSQYLSDRLLGQLDEFRIWNTARTAEEIQANKDKELTGNEAGLLVYYDFNQNTPSNLTYLWVFNGPDTFVSDKPNPTVTFNATATYTVGLTVSDGITSKTETKTDYITIKGCEPDWPVTGTADYHIALVPDNADITLEGQSIASGDYIGAFYNDNGILKCAGKAQWTGNYLSVTVYGDDATTSDKEGFGTGESFQWKVWKAATNQEFFGSATYEAPTGRVTHTGQFAINGISQINRLTGTTQPPQTATQTITLAPGWNYISSYIIANQSNMPAVFSAIQSDIVIAKNGKGEVYMPTPFVNDIGNWNVVDGYQVKLKGNSVKQLTLTGEKVNLANTSIRFSAGHNLFAYLRETEQPVQVAMAPVADEVDLITDEEGRAYIPAFGINNIGNMKPGKGYWAKMKSAVSLNYTARIATPPANMHTAQLMPRHFRIHRKGAYHATILLNTKDFVTLGDEVGVFDAKGDLVGAATYEDYLMAFPIWGDDPTTSEIDGLEEGAEFEIRVWNKKTGVEKVFAFNANVDVYTTNGVIEAELLRTTATPSLFEANSLKLYPNPTRNQATLSLNLKSQATVEIALFDLAGKQVLRIDTENKTAGNHEWKLNTTSLPSGLYHCKVLVDGITHNIPFSVVK